MRLNSKTLVLMCGPIGAGKSTFCSKYFNGHIVSADHFRELISGDANNQDVSRNAFELLTALVETKMKLGFPVVIDNLNHKAKSRRDWFKLAEKYGYRKEVILFDEVTLETCQKQNASRQRVVPSDIVEKSFNDFHDGLKHLADDSIDVTIHATSVIESFEFIDVVADNTNNKYVVIGDIHGCADELNELLEKIKADYSDHQIVFVGDFADRGPKNAGVIATVSEMVESGRALATRGNHEDKAERWLKGNKIKVGNGLGLTIAEIEALPNAAEFKEKTLQFFGSLPLYHILDGGKLIVVHAGIDDSMIGKVNNGAIRTFCLYGKVTGKIDDAGFPERLDWAASRVITDNSPTIVYGHHAQINGEPYVINKTVNVDTACVFGQKLTGFVYPENKFVSVNAKKEYCVYHRYSKEAQNV